MILTDHDLGLVIDSILTDYPGLVSLDALKDLIHDQIRRAPGYSPDQLERAVRAQVNLRLQGDHY